MLHFWYQSLQCGNSLLVSVSFTGEGECATTGFCDWGTRSSKISNGLWLVDMVMNIYYQFCFHVGCDEI